MSNSGHENVGYGKPPIKHRFSKDNQPPRRRKKALACDSTNVLVHIMAALAEDVSISENGKKTKAKASAVLARLIVKQGVSGSLNEQLKFAKFLSDAGEFDPDKIRHEIEEEYAQALEHERQQYRDVLDILQGMHEGLPAWNRHLTLVSNAFLGAESRCSCGAFDDCSEVAPAIVEWSSEEGAGLSGEFNSPTSEQQTGWGPTTKSGPYCDEQVNDVPTKVGTSPPIDDLAAGMIGND